MGEYVDAVYDLQQRLAPLIGERSLPAPRWIVTPNGDLGSEWCSDCGHYKVRNLRRRDRKRADGYLLDGGWRTEEDRFCFCAGCGTRLDVSLTRYAVDEEVAHYEECGFSASTAEDAYELNELLDTVHYRSDDESEDDVEVRAAVIALTSRFLAEQAPGAAVTQGSA